MNVQRINATGIGGGLEGHEKPSGRRHNCQEYKARFNRAQQNVDG